VPQPFGRADSPRQAGVCGSPQTLEHTNTIVRHVTVVGQFSSASVGLVVPGTSAVVHDREQECVALSPSARAVRPAAASARWVVARAKWSTGSHCALRQARAIRLPQRNGSQGSNCAGSRCNPGRTWQALRSCSVVRTVRSCAPPRSRSKSTGPLPARRNNPAIQYVCSNPSVEPTAPGKPVSAAHLKR
jgi:hypothetical protein